MGRFVKGDVVVVPFPFSDLSEAKRRPALVLAPLMGDDVILCQITTPARLDGYSIPISRADFETGRLDRDCFVRPNRLFTADSNIVIRAAGRLSQGKIGEVVEKVIEIVRG